MNPLSMLPGFMRGYRTRDLELDDGEQPRKTSYDNAWWGVVLREPRLTAAGNGLLLYLDKANMAVDSDR